MMSNFIVPWRKCGRSRLTRKLKIAVNHNPYHVIYNAITLLFSDRISSFFACCHIATSLSINFAENKEDYEGQKYIMMTLSLLSPYSAISIETNSRSYKNQNMISILKL